MLMGSPRGALRGSLKASFGGEALPEDPLKDSLEDTPEDPLKDLPEERIPLGIPQKTLVDSVEGIS